MIRVSRRPQLHFAYSHVTVRQEQLASCIYSVFMCVPTHNKTALQRHTFRHVPSRSRPVRHVCQLLYFTHLLLCFYCKSGRDNVAVVISCVSRHHIVVEEVGFDHVPLGFLRLAFQFFCRGTSLWSPPPPPTPTSLLHPPFPALCCCQC